MSSKQLAQLLLRLWGVALIIWALASVGSVFLFFVPVEPESMRPAMRASEAAAALHILVYLVAGGFLIRNGDRIGEWLVSDIDSEPSTPASAAEIESVAFAILGAYFLVTGVRELAGVLASLFVYLRPVEVSGLAAWWERDREIGIASVVNIIAGIILLNRRHNLAATATRAWNVLRSRASSRSDESGD